MAKWTKGLVAALVLGSVSLASLPALAQTVDQKQADQQRRIQQGVESGQLTPKEARHLQKEVARLRAKEARMKADGRVTPQERAKLQKELDGLDRKIYRQKHDPQAMPGAAPPVR
jgi:septal ring factor EnvC (AmiA/AmiB activator)